MHGTQSNWTFSFIVMILENRYVGRWVSKSPYLSYNMLLSLDVNSGLRTFFNVNTDNSVGRVNTSFSLSQRNNGRTPFNRSMHVQS